MCMCTPNKRTPCCGESCHDKLRRTYGQGAICPFHPEATVQSKIIRWAQVRCEIEGVHHYPNAPEEVSFLRHPHRHVFHIRLYVEQFHNERDIEYIILLRWLKHLVVTTDWALTTSCEQMAQVIGTHARAQHIANGKSRRVMVEVTEDGENGALLEFGDI